MRCFNWDNYIVWKGKGFSREYSEKITQSWGNLKFFFIEKA